MFHGLWRRGRGVSTEIPYTFPRGLGVEGLGGLDIAFASLRSLLLRSQALVKVHFKAPLPTFSGAHAQGIKVVALAMMPHPGAIQSAGPYRFPAACANHSLCRLRNVDFLPRAIGIE